MISANLTVSWNVRPDPYGDFIDFRFEAPDRNGWIGVATAPAEVMLSPSNGYVVLGLPQPGNSTVDRRVLGGYSASLITPVPGPTTLFEHYIYVDGSSTVLVFSRRNVTSDKGDGIYSTQPGVPSTFIYGLGINATLAHHVDQGFGNITLVAQH